MDTLRRLAIVGSRSASLGKVEERERTEAKERDKRREWRLGLSVSLVGERYNRRISCGT
jgi:hypothetical protein